MEVAFVAPEEDPQRWLPGLRAALPAARFHVWPEIPDPGAIEAALVAKPPAGALGAFPALKLIQSLWMGVDGLLADPSLPRGVPLARLVDPGMVAAMGETVLARVLDWHRHLYRYRAQQAARVWQPLPQRLAAERSVGLLGLGEPRPATLPAPAVAPRLVRARFSPENAHPRARQVDVRKPLAHPRRPNHLCPGRAGSPRRLDHFLARRRGIGHFHAPCFFRTHVFPPYSPAAR